MHAGVKIGIFRFFLQFKDSGEFGANSEYAFQSNERKGVFVCESFARVRVCM